MDTDGQAEKQGGNEKMRRNRLFGWMARLTSAALAAIAAAAPVMAAVSESSPGGGGNSGSGERVEEAAEEKEDGRAESPGFAGAAAPGVTAGNEQETGMKAEENQPAAQESGAHGEDTLNKPAAQSGGAGTETTGVYEFPDTKTSGTVTVVKKWDDQSSNEERPSVDMVNISLSTQKPSKNPLGYTVTFHADAEKGLTFEDGNTINEVVYNGNGQAISGIYKRLVGGSGVVRWYTDKTYQTRIELDENGQPAGALTEDVDAWPKEVTFEIKGKGGADYITGFKEAIPSTTTTVVFTDEIIPADAALIDVDADEDGGVVAWTEENGTVMKVSTQIKGVKVQAAKDSTSMFSDKSKIQTIDFTNLDTTKVTSMGLMFSGCRGLTNLDVSSLDTSQVTRMDGMFKNCSRLTSLDVSKFNTANVTDMSGMFKDCTGLTSLDVSALNTAKVTDMAYMFSNCTLTSLNLSTWETSRVKDMTAMFYDCENLTDLNLINFNTTNVLYFSSCSHKSYPQSGMFGNCSKLENINIIFTFSEKAKSLDGMFSNCYELKTINTTNWKIKDATCMRSMFSDCRNLASLDLSSFNTGNVTNMGGMFSNCYKLTSLDVSKFDTANVTSMGDMFRYCYRLTSLDVSSFDTTNVTSMGNMFFNCSELTSLDVSSFSTANVTNMSRMFSYCSNLTSLDVSSFDTANVTDMGSMFSQCSRLTNLDVTSFDTYNVTNMSRMFEGCSRLTSLEVTSFDTCNVTSMSNMFSSCKALTILTTGVNFKFIGTNYYLLGTWQNTAGETFTCTYSDSNFPSNVADTYTRVK